MGAEVSEVIVADRCNRHGSDWNYNGWGAVGGALVGGGFGAAAVSVWDKINDVKANVESVKASIKEQYEAGCRYFDIRYKWSDERATWVCAHGLWESEKDLYDILKEINSFGDCYVMLTCESGEEMNDMDMNLKLKSNPQIKFTSFNVKHPEWEVVKCNHPTPHINAYKVLNWDTWHTLLPIPWLWKKIYYNKPVFNNTTFTFVDFL